ncbi:MAG: BON domain-containing protein [Caulobacterales bacterium]|jgi:osmotically-inducible protein OsmY
MNDTTLKILIEDELSWEPSIDAADVAATVDAGIVTLDGHVPNYVQKRMAETVVKRIKGVRGFVDRIEVRPFGSDAASDESIATRAANVLDWDVTVPKRSVQVQVSEGRVTLTGHVDWQFQRDAADRAVRRLSGIRAVFNQIEVKPHVQAADIKRRIEAALERQADLAASKIRVTVSEDKVRLDGEVRAWAERDIAERAAWAAPGVRAVDDHVSIVL